MKIRCGKEILEDVLAVNIKAVSAKSSMSILKCVLLKAENVFSMYSTDMEMNVEYKEIPAQIEETGSVALNATMFADIVRKMPDGEITIESDEKNLTRITCGKVKFNIAGTAGEEFPKFPAYEKTNPIVISSSKLKSLIKCTSFSIARESTKTVFKGELFEISPSCLNVVSVDGYRISLASVGISADTEISAVVPGKTLLELEKTLPENVDVNMYFSERQVVFELPEYVFSSILLNGEFLNYRQSLKSDGNIRAVVSKSEFFASLDRAMLISRDDNANNPVTLKFSEDTMRVSSEAEIGDVVEELSAEIDGGELEILFNPKFLADALKVIEDASIEIYLSAPLSPCIIKNTGVKEEDTISYQYLVLPLRSKR
ncbi:DNA polymerase III subunit beta [Clostridia bacterium]|nr:DNA polymerase III subunit beta [Clostridia bacterium]